MLSLIWIQAVWHWLYSWKNIFEKSNFEKNQHTIKIHAKIILHDFLLSAEFFQILIQNEDFFLFFDKTFIVLLIGCVSSNLFQWVCLV